MPRQAQTMALSRADRGFQERLMLLPRSLLPDVLQKVPPHWRKPPKTQAGHILLRKKGLECHLLVLDTPPPSTGMGKRLKTQMGREPDIRQKMAMYGFQVITKALTGLIGMFNTQKAVTTRSTLNRWENKMKLLSNRELKQMSFPIPADVLWREVEDDNLSKSLLTEHHRFCPETNPRELWNQIGSEKMSASQCEIFASRLTDVLSRIDSLPVVACHYGLMTPKPWLPSKAMTRQERMAQAQNADFKLLRHSALSYLKQNFSPVFKGAIVLDTCDELKQFLTAMIASPTVLHYLEIYLLSTMIPLAIEIHHHADIFFYSPLGGEGVLSEIAHGKGF